MLRAQPTGSSDRGTKPPVGNQPSQTPNMMIIRMPNQNSGTDRPISATIIAPWSRSVLCRTAARMPSSMPVSVASASDSPASDSVTGSLSITASTHGSA
ncbi:MAG: hypothetical protein KatS3mg118_0743 [Paracoccaceae bacterium]|nr:MAG: hypothetical protein KatS3mg118_0743 [Paracoccaceae bacterium]